MIVVLEAVKEMETRAGVGVRTGVGARVLVGRGVWVGTGRRVGVDGGRVAVATRVTVKSTTGVFVGSVSNIGVNVGVTGTVTGVIVGASVGDRLKFGVGVTLGAMGITTIVDGVGVPGSVLTSARRLK